MRTKKKLKVIFHLIQTIYLMKRKKKTKQQKQKRRAKYWVHPIIQLRNSIGFYKVYVPVLRTFEDKFKFVFHVPIFLFDLICEAVTPLLVRKSPRALPPDFKCYVYFRYIVGESVATLATSFLIGVSTVRRYVNEVSKAIIEQLSSEYMAIPKTEKEWLSISDEFEKQRNFPHILGAIDGRHCKIVKPDNSGSQFFNYKNFFSIVLLCICDANYSFIYAQCGSYGSESDGGIFKNSKIVKWIEDKSLNLPEPKDILGLGKIPFFFVGDAAFGQGQYVLKPYSGLYLDQDKEIFNKRLSSARIAVEQSFGILCNTFRFLLNAIYAEPDQAEDQILSACVVHNMLRYFSTHNDKAPYELTFVEQDQGSEVVDNYRDALKNILYF